MSVVSTGFITALPYILSGTCKFIIGPLSDKLTCVSQKTRFIYFAALSQGALSICIFIMSMVWFITTSKSVLDNISLNCPNSIHSGHRFQWDQYCRSGEMCSSCLPGTCPFCHVHHRLSYVCCRFPSSDDRLLHLPWQYPGTGNPPIFLEFVPVVSFLLHNCYCGGSLLNSVYLSRKRQTRCLVGYTDRQPSWKQVVSLDYL